MYFRDGLSLYMVIILYNFSFLLYVVIILFIFYLLLFNFRVQNYLNIEKIKIASIS